MKICISCSAGGHLIEALQIREAYEGYEHFFITFYQKGIIDELKGKKVYFLENPQRNLLKFLKCAFRTLEIFLKEKPNLIISTGAGLALPSIIIGKVCFGSKVIFIESFTRVYQPSLSGRIAYYFSDLFFVQWKFLLKKYGRKAIYRGAVI
ncbi:MAG: UDP-N-acetylglucosamine transferase subunit ALG14 [Candidatus Aenigmarchaeota archaeon]|nr:UDP-N-acetylglucosamine transferase subunit ALG14 [Candidatus Aenigmarchaeota archaeon]